MNDNERAEAIAARVSQAADGVWDTKTIVTMTGDEHFVWVYGVHGAKVIVAKLNSPDDADFVANAKDGLSWLLGQRAALLEKLSRETQRAGGNLCEIHALKKSVAKLKEESDGMAMVAWRQQEDVKSLERQLAEQRKTTRHMESQVDIEVSRTLKVDAKLTTMTYNRDNAVEQSRLFGEVCIERDRLKRDLKEANKLAAKQSADLIELEAKLLILRVEELRVERAARMVTQIRSVHMMGVMPLNPLCGSSSALTTDDITEVTCAACEAALNPTPPRALDGVCFDRWQGGRIVLGESTRPVSASVWGTGDGRAAWVIKGFTDDGLTVIESGTARTARDAKDCLLDAALEHGARLSDELTL